MHTNFTDGAHEWGTPSLMGVTLAVIAGALVWTIFPRKERVPALSQEIVTQESMQEIKVTSSAFEHNRNIPADYTCDGKDVSPPLEISGLPEETKTLALIMHDPDAPRAGGWTHWVKWNMHWNMKDGTGGTKEGEEPIGVSGKGSGGTTTYQGPCPPSGTHRYFFIIYALDSELQLKEGATKTELESAMQGHILGQGQLTGLYSRKH